MPGAMVQQSNFLGNQPNLVGYQAAEQNSFSGEPFYCMRFLSNTIVIITVWLVLTI
jgi:hypothetical protein